LGKRPIAGAVGVMVEAPDVEMDPSDDLDVLRHCIALALQTCERQRIAAQNLDEVQTLQRVATRILKSHDLSEILLHITQEAKRLLSADICGVLLRDGDQIAMRRCVGNHSPETASLRMRPGQGLAGRVLERREPSAVEDYLTSDVISRDFFHLAEAEMVRSALAAPLLRRDVVIGVLEVWRRRPSTFTALDNIRLVALANLTSIAIENAELYAVQGRMVDELGRANEAMNRRYDTVRSPSNLTQSLMQIVLQGGSLSDIVASASSFLQVDVAIVDSDGLSLA
jgi:GAF domain-containing protein